MRFLLPLLAAFISAQCAVWNSDTRTARAGCGGSVEYTVPDGIGVEKGLKIGVLECEQNGFHAKVDIVAMASGTFKITTRGPVEQGDMIFSIVNE